MSDAPDSTSLMIENAVMRSAEAFRKEVNTTFDKQQEKTEKLVISLHETYVKEVSDTSKLAETAHEIAKKALEKSQSNEKALSNISAKVIALIAAAGTVTGFVGFLAAQVVVR